MGLKNAMHTYAQFTDMVFGPLPRTEGTERAETIISDYGESSFSPLVDDHMGAATSFDAMFKFLYERYFP